MAEPSVGKRVDAATSDVLIMSDWAMNAAIADSINEDTTGQAYVDFEGAPNSEGGFVSFFRTWAFLHGLPASSHSPPAPLPSAKEAIKHLRKRIAHSNDKVVQLAFMVRCLRAMVAWSWNF